jgi:hypothetical protein
MTKPSRIVLKWLMFGSGMAVVLIAFAWWYIERYSPVYGIYYYIAKLTGSPLDIGYVHFETLRRHATPNDALVCPPRLCRNATPDIIAPTYALSPIALRARMRDIAWAEPNVGELYSVDDNVRFVQYSGPLHIPDTIDIAAFPAGDGKSTLAIYSRRVLDIDDDGVNIARVKRWLEKLSTQVRGQ